MSDNNSSTAKSYLDSAIAQGQSALGSLTGSTGDKVSQNPSHPSSNTTDTSLLYLITSFETSTWSDFVKPSLFAIGIHPRETTPSLTRPPTHRPKPPPAKTKPPPRKKPLTPSASSAPSTFPHPAECPPMTPTAPKVPHQSIPRHPILSLSPCNH